ncbi:GH36-type glycosyl hydrolase domain-containing protein [Paraglaciecola sp. L3A3]|uniref:GH36-type glycosyl hydrolase domain-containing protein n=1 Tax=Paraglaciecola sp. L3A3 TaxID=2686358 RepID=UPI00131D921E|nr:NdvB protein [Paraglaciecola sp. L3A3]
MLKGNFCSIERHDDGARYVLKSPTILPNASGFLWNKNMLIQANCRGYALAQFMQPDAGKYVSGPAFEAKTFMQPEQPYYANHPGRFVYVKDNADGSFFSAPYEPVRVKLDRFEFIAEPHQITWLSEYNKIRLTLCLRLPTEAALECWQVTVEDLSGQGRDLSIYPYFPIGYRSWMNQSGKFEPALNAVVCRSIEPYQKVDDYYKNKSLHELTFLAADVPADSWETSQHIFEGEGGLHQPSAIQQTSLNNSVANYCTPTAVMQFKARLKPKERKSIHLLFGPAKDFAQISAYKSQFLTHGQQEFDALETEFKQYLHRGKGVLQIDTPDTELNAYVNHWMARQLYYHGDVNRLTTDPQTRNYLQDNMGMAYILPKVSRAAFILALSQQNSSGEMPDGILITAGAELKYINQVPHTDHCVWLPICLKAYLDETGDYGLLDQQVAFADTEQTSCVSEHIKRAMFWLDKSRDHRGLSYINQGDWCDPMNMVGFKGKGVSAWLSLASAYAMSVWVDIQNNVSAKLTASNRTLMQKIAEINQQVNQHCWVEDRFARGITDDGRVFGIAGDNEGKIFLNPQSWAFLSGAASGPQIPLMLNAIKQNLDTPYGCMMLAPCFTNMVEDIGRVTQKFPGTAENGSVYNHASAFYAYSLFTLGESDLGFEQLKKMLSTDKDILTKGQLPLFIPNYYRGAYYQFPNEAGKSSQLFNTGTVAWFYRCLIEQVFGVSGCKQGLLIKPQLPSDWPQAKIIRQFRGATFKICYLRDKNCLQQEVWLDEQLLESNCITEFTAGNTYQVVVKLPFIGANSHDK